MNGVSSKYFFICFLAIFVKLSKGSCNFMHRLDALYSKCIYETKAIRTIFCLLYSYSRPAVLGDVLVDNVVFHCCCSILQFALNQPHIEGVCFF